MNVKFCQECGSKMKHLFFGEGHWSEMLQCENCSLKCEISFGDPVGGSRDQIHWFKDKRVLGEKVK